MSTGDVVTPDEDCFKTPLVPDGEAPRKTPFRKRTRLFADTDGDAPPPAAKRRKQGLGEVGELLTEAQRNFTAEEGSRFGHFGSYVASLCRQLEDSQAKLEALGEPPSSHLLEVKERAIRLFDRQILKNLERIRRLEGRLEEAWD